MNTNDQATGHLTGGSTRSHAGQIQKQLNHSLKHTLIWARV
jgi:hypothetical protein